jgi:hypothetical protein
MVLGRRFSNALSCEDSIVYAVNYRDLNTQGQYDKAVIDSENIGLLPIYSTTYSTTTILCDGLGGQ